LAGDSESLVRVAALQMRFGKVKLK